MGGTVSAAPVAVANTVSIAAVPSCISLMAIKLWRRVLLAAPHQESNVREGAAGRPALRLIAIFL